MFNDFSKHRTEREAMGLGFEDVLDDAGFSRGIHEMFEVLS